MGKPEKFYGSRLGYYLDGWADIIEGMGWKAEDVREDIMKQLEERDMPHVTIKEVNMHEGVTSFVEEPRDYIISTTFPGVTTTIYVAKHGSDLFASWRTFIHNTINWELMAIYYLVAFAISIIINLPSFDSLVNYYSQRAPQPKATSDWPSFFSFCGITIGIFISILTLEEIVDFYAKRNNYDLIQLKRKIITFFDKDNDPGTLTEKSIKENFLGIYGIIAFILGLIIFGLSRWELDATERTQRWNEFVRDISDILPILLPIILKIILYSMAGFFIILIFVIPVGIILKQNILAFILKEPSLFDKEDIAAMSLTVHKTLLRALDKAGIDKSRLRLKGVFKAGRRGEEI